MRITPIKNYTYFKAQPAKKIADPNQYILDIDAKTKALPDTEIAWDKIYALGPINKQNLAQLLKLTHKNYGQFRHFPKDKIFNAGEGYLNAFYAYINSINTGDSPTELNVESLAEKVEGAFTIGEVERIKTKEFRESEEAKGNLKFIKELLKPENISIFHEASSRTIAEILANDFTTYDEYMHSLQRVKKAGVCDVRRKENREIIHTYLTDESYFKTAFQVDEYDRRFYW